MQTNQKMRRTLFSLRALAAFNLIVQLAGVPAPVKSQPFQGDLKSSGGIFLKYICSPNGENIIQCSLIYITLLGNSEPSEKAAATYDNALEWTRLVLEDDRALESLCSQIFELVDLPRLLMAGDFDAARERYDAFIENNPNPDGAPDFDEVQQEWEGATNQERRDRARMSGLVSRVCEDQSQENVQAMISAQVDMASRACGLSVTHTWKVFEKAGQGLWTAKASRPQGLCGLQDLDRFECGTHEIICDFVAEKRPLREFDAEGEACLSLPAERYQFSTDPLYLHCDRLIFR